MNTLKIERDARVVASDGEAGRVTQVVVDPQTREVTDMVVDHDGQQWLVPIGEVTSTEKGTVRVRGTRAQLRSAGRFERDQFDALAAERADAETQGRAAHGGAPLRDAQENAVEIGGTEQTTTTVTGSTPRPARPQTIATQSTQKPAAPTTPARGSDAQRLELREEELLVRKQSVQSGEVALRTDVVSEQRTLDVPVTREEVTIERHRVDRQPTDQPIAASGETISVPVRQEQVTLDKQAVVYEEIEVGKRAVQETKQVSDTVRREKAVVDKEGQVDVRDVDKEQR